MSYEDFIEGIKPETINENICYRNVDGLFKQICTKATYSAYVKSVSKGLSRDKIFEVVYDRLLETINKAIAEGKSYEIMTKENRPIEVVEITDYRNLIIMHKQEMTGTRHTVSR
ncbi:MAG: hypothetical protein PHH43_08935, partial [Candidatus Cloacimonetes bacterium]|nr:hypothetical protein [Candidatus Cloacimonadota bacterium]